MCKPFSSISNGEGKVKMFSYQQRRDKVTMRDGTEIENYDSHTSIATYYGIKGEKEDLWNKWEYNPFTDKLVLDKQNTYNDSDAILQKMREIDWEEMCGDVEAIKGLLVQITLIPWFENDGELPDGVKLFDTRYDARDAALEAALESYGEATWDAAWDAARYADRDAAWDAALEAARDAAREAAWEAARYAALEAAWEAARDAALEAAWEAARDAALEATGEASWDAARDAAWDAARSAALLAYHYVCDGIDIDPKHMEHAKLRWRVLEAGYGVACDVDGVIYAYRKP